jgi:diaminohydroxyphosphoribosylaminopyrimidine deaminase / 5-amino-6-(5-phosphoribosylamino)uracil reductase
VDNEKYMRRCFELANKAKGRVSPNPLVGAVIVHEDKIIGEGYHQLFGAAHAEVNAIASVKNQDLLSKSTLYVNLEPCTHFGKTPPCTDLILKKRIPRVVLSTPDPNPTVNGSGIKKLRDNKVTVLDGVLRDEGLELNKYFFSQFKKERAHITLKWAQTSDGFIGRNALSKTSSSQISSKMSQVWLHKLRSEIDAILVGINTVIEDDPLLNTRNVPGKSPLRFVIDTKDRIPMDSKLISDQSPVIVLSNKNEEGPNWQKVDCGMKGVYNCLFEQLALNNCLSILVEGGTKTLNGFIKENLWDEAYVLKSQIVWTQGIVAPPLNHESRSTSQLEDTELTHYVNK